MKLNRFAFAAALLLIGSLHIAEAQTLGAPNSTATQIGQQTADHVALTGGTIDGTVIGGTTPAAGTFTALTGTSAKFTGTAPAPTGTGSPTIAAGSTDTAGEVTAGTSATSVVITFATAKTSAPFCTVTPQTGGIASFAYAITTTAITVTQSATSGDKIDYACVQH